MKSGSTETPVSAKLVSVHRRNTFYFEVIPSGHADLPGCAKKKQSS